MTPTGSTTAGGKRMKEKMKQPLHDHKLVWNPWIGCTKASPGCKNCLMYLQQTARHVSPSPQVIRRCTSTWDRPGKWQREAYRQNTARPAFVCGYSDFFLAEADGWRPEAWSIIRDCPNIFFLIQTKRTERILSHLPSDWGNGYGNVALGASVESKKYLSRIPQLRAVPSATLRYLDICPCLESMVPDLGEYLEGIGWVIVAGETGCGITDDWRPFDLQWARDIRDLCRKRNIPFRFGHTAGKARNPSHLLDGQVYHELPEIYPKDAVSPDEKQTGRRYAGGK